MTSLLLAGRRLPDLLILEAARVRLHEDADPQRVASLAGRLARDGILRNPPVAAALPGGAGFAVLDGANRTAALARLRYPATLVQLVDYHSPAVELSTWRHLLAESDAAALAGRLRDAGFDLERTVQPDAEAALGDRAAHAYLIGRDGVAWAVRSPAPHAAALSAVVAAYRGRERIYRVLSGDVASLEAEYGRVGALVVFPALTKDEILAAAADDAKLPTGITRHVIPGRALRLDLPLSVLAGDPVEGNAWLREFVHQKLVDGRVRYYQEATFLFDE